MSARGGARLCGGDSDVWRSDGLAQPYTRDRERGMHKKRGPVALEAMSDGEGEPTYDYDYFDRVCI